MNDPIVQPVLTLVGQLGLAGFFLLAWWQERKERQDIQRKLEELHERHKDELLKVLDRFFEVANNRSIERSQMVSVEKSPN